MTKISHVRLWVFVSFLALAGAMLCPRQIEAAGWVSITVENRATAAGKGVDTLLANAIVYGLGYSIFWVDCDSIGLTVDGKLWNSAFFDTFSLNIAVGSEVALPSPSDNLDTIANAVAPFIAMGYDQWNEINLGSSGTIGGSPDIRTLMSSGYARNVAPTLWATKTIPDTLQFASSSSNPYYGIGFPDSLHDIKVLLLSPPRIADSSVVICVIADSGATIINTLGGYADDMIAKDRRGFWALQSNTGVYYDSCQYYGSFIRFCAWVAKDTLNDIMMKNLCFSGKYEYDDSWGEYNSDHFNSYGGWSSNYIGWDYDEKVSFFQIFKKAQLRKLVNVYRSITTDSIYTKKWLGGVGVEAGGGPDDWAQAWTFKPLKVAWWVGRENGTQGSPFATYEWRYINTTPNPDDTVRWTTDGAQGEGTDRHNLYVDSVHHTEAGWAAQYYSCALPEAPCDTTFLDTAKAFGWVSDILYTNQNGTNPPGAEFISISSDAGGSDMAHHPTLIVRFSAYSTTVPPPTIVASPTSFSVSVVQGNNYPTQGLTITNSGGGAMDYSPSVVGGTWLSVNCIECTAPGLVSVIFNTSLLTVASYSDTINIVATGATNTPLKVPVNLTVTAVPPTTTAGQVSGVLRSRQ